jgi:hypothetical protein
MDTITEDTAVHPTPSPCKEVLDNHSKFVSFQENYPSTLMRK